MIHDITYFRKLHDALGAQNAKQAAQNSLRKRISRDFQRPINWEQTEVNGVRQELLIMKTPNVSIKKVEARPGELLRLGDLVMWCGIYWLVTAQEADNSIQYAGTMTRCNTVLRWQGHDLKLCEAYAVAEDATKYGTGVSDNALMRIGEFALKLKVQMNDDTLRIHRDQRFLIGEYADGAMPNAYIASRMNQVTGTYVEQENDQLCNYGYIEVTLLEDQFRPSSDRADLMIADYVEPETSEDEPSETGGIDW